MKSLPSLNPAIPTTKYSALRLKQVLDFVRADLKMLTDGQLLDLRSDLIGFAAGLGRPYELSPEALPLRLLRQLQNDLNDALETFFVEGMPWDLPAVPRKWTITPPSPRATRKGEPQPPPEVTFPLQPFRGAFLPRAVLAFFAHWHDIRRCPQCGGFFLRVRRRKYCSDSCRSATFAPRRKRDYRAEYRNRLRRSI